MVRAYVLVTAEAGRAGDVVKNVSGVAGVKSVHAVTGPYDAIAFVEASDFNAIGELVVAKIQKIEGVSRTLTCIVVEL
ncbi:MAG TPA: AsnC family transcriptional regulator [Actinobacteria bacterium]|nr:AsnC family transcriptional regulator [Actinomycetota bacterium]